MDVGTHEVKVEIAGRTMYGERVEGWGLLPDSLAGWWDSLESRFDEDVIPGADGAFDVDEVLTAPRRVTVTGVVTSTSADWSIAEVRAWLASLVKIPDLQFRVLAGGAWLSLRNAKVRGQVFSRPDFTGKRVEFEIPVWSADPRKYGRIRQISMDAVVEATGGLAFPIVDGSIGFGGTGGVLFPGVFAITNPGTAEFYPEAFTVTGPVSGFTIQSESWVVEYDGPIAAGQQLVITPYAGGRAVLGGGDVSNNLLRAEWVPVAPGETRGFLFTPTDPGPGAGIVIDYPEGSWW
ncbi:MULTISPECIES: hypothetical protein [unclassified Microbacterium]|uniref:hypothetical protein n=1 Tax=unclassified Microbacterium TaxID=2609290 RepID=UPI0030190209